MYRCGGWWVESSHTCVRVLSKTSGLASNADTHGAYKLKVRRITHCNWYEWVCLSCETPAKSSQTREVCEPVVSLASLIERVNGELPEADIVYQCPLQQQLTTTAEITACLPCILSCSILVILLLILLCVRFVHVESMLPCTTIHTLHGF